MKTDTEGLVSIMWPMVRQNLTRFGRLTPCAFIRTPKGLQIVGIDAALLASPAGIETIAQTLRDRIAEQRATEVVVVAGAWEAALDSIESDSVNFGAAVQRAKYWPKMTEVVFVQVHRKDGVRSGTAPITRDTDGRAGATVEPPELHPATSSMRLF